MTNFSRWLSYTEGLPSPQNFCEWTWRFIIAAALQRRVSFNGDPKSGHMVCYPNTYTVLVGPAGVGKGVVINPAIELLKYWKKKDLNMADSSTDEVEKKVLSSIDEANSKDADESTIKMRSGQEKIEPVLFPYAPDATTYEALVEGMGQSFRRKNILEEINGERKLGIYGHCSMYFALPELGSLLRKRTDDTVNFLLGLYDNPTDYEYKTKTKGQDRVRRGCLSILAGTTPEFMETIFDQRLIDQGFSSRTFFVFASKNRKHVFSPAQLTFEQKEHKTVLLNHIKKLASLYGEVKVSQETRDWLQNWWVSENEGEKKSNQSPKLNPYRARKNIHVIKVAMQIHFSESIEMEIPLDRFQEAAEVLFQEEKNMHMALTFHGDNPLGPVTDAVLLYIQSKKEVDLVDLTLTHWSALPKGKLSMDEVLEFLLGQGKIKTKEIETQTGKTKTVFIPI